MQRLSWISASALCAAVLPVPAQAATLIVEGGILTGATGVQVSGQNYAVEFTDGTCAALFTGCDDAGDFIPQTVTEAAVFGQALLDQVLLDGPQGFFGSSPALTRGCTHLQECAMWIPFAATSRVSRSAIVYNVTDGNGIVDGAASPFVDFAAFSHYTWARFSSAAVTAVPEPSTWAMLILGFGMVGGSLRSVRRKQVTVTYA